MITHSFAFFEKFKTNKLLYFQTNIKVNRCYETRRKHASFSFSVKNPEVELTFFEHYHNMFINK